MKTRRPRNMQSGMSSTALLRISCTAAMGSLLFGYDTGVISGALLYIIPDFHLQNLPMWQGAVVSAALVGAMVGTAVSGAVSDWWGRRSCLRITAALFVIGGVMMSLAMSVSVLIGGRILVGLAVGAASSTVPVYIAECAPSAVRGKISTLPQLLVSTGILLSYMSAFVVSLTNAPQWRLMLGLSIPPALVFGVLLLWVPESPRWLSLHGQSMRVPSRLRLTGETGMAQGTSQSFATDDELHLLQNRDEIIKRQRLPNVSLSSGTSMLNCWKEVKESLADSQTMRALAVGCCLQGFQQVCGINAVVYYTPDILKRSGIVQLTRLKEDSAAILATIISYSIKIPCIFLAMHLMDTVGRRTLLLYSIPLMTLALLSLSVSYQFISSGSMQAINTMLSLALYGCSFVVGMGPIPTIICSEIFPDSIRGLAVSICIVVNFLCNFLVSQLFPEMVYALGLGGTFSLFALASASSWLFVYSSLPETKGKPLEETTKLFC